MPSISSTPSLHPTADRPSFRLWRSELIAAASALGGSADWFEYEQVELRRQDGRLLLQYVPDLRHTHRIDGQLSALDEDIEGYLQDVARGRAVRPLTFDSYEALMADGLNPRALLDIRPHVLFPILPSNAHCEEALRRLNSNPQRASSVGRFPGPSRDLPCAVQVEAAPRDMQAMFTMP